MSGKNETLSLLLTLAITGAIIGGGYFWLKARCDSGQGSFLCNVSGGSSTSVPNPTTSPADVNPSPAAGETLPPPPSPAVATNFNSPTSIPSGTTININGSTSMVQANAALKTAMEKKFPGVKVSLEAQGSRAGISALKLGTIDIAAVSLPLTPEDQQQGLVAIPVVRDAIAIVVGRNNPVGTSLTSDQIKGIFTGAITNWSAVNGSPAAIRVLNRPDVSGTHQIFRQEVLGGVNFGSGSNFTTMSRDATTPLLQSLGIDGIGYATYPQVARQQTVRTISVDGIAPTNPNYPFQRTLYYVYKNPPNENVKAFMGFVSSPEGQQAIAIANEKLEK
ncbi:MAG: hypothetical protein N5P05_002363 [Chroococcopsis gigantea SAG 12.99]|jgi:phosphate transport system substrate-binding protein|nr:substrate-binding domain-containing protein [Chlorogloea purpurea SAG 13.99]MDV3000757.1 hypothetical protein [Chroococcopsis gigantea SAG 12.99]